jgi:hypothetical protein
MLNHQRRIFEEWSPGKYDPAGQTPGAHRGRRCEKADQALPAR